MMMMNVKKTEQFKHGVRGQITRLKPVRIGRTVAQIWRFNGLQNGGPTPSWIFDIQFL